MPPVEFVTFPGVSEGRPQHRDSTHSTATTRSKVSFRKQPFGGKKFMDTPFGRSNILTPMRMQALPDIAVTPLRGRTPSVMHDIENEVRRRMPHLVHLAEDEREALPFTDRLQRRLEYGRFLCAHRQELLSAPAPRATTPAGYTSAASHLVKPKLPIIDFSFQEIDSCESLLRATPKTGRVAPRKEVEAPTTREALIQKAIEHATSQGGKWVGGKMTLMIGGERIVVVRERRKTYAFVGGDYSSDNDDDDDNSSDDVVFPGGKNRDTFAKARPRRVSIAPQAEASAPTATQYVGGYVKLCNNSIPSLDNNFRQTLTSILASSLVVLDLSSNRITTISSDFVGDPQLEESEMARNNALCNNNGGRDMNKTRTLRRAALGGGCATIFMSLTTIFLHGNCIVGLSEILKLEPLNRTLQFLTVHGNPKVDEELAARGGRNRKALLKTFPNLVALNFTTLTADDAP